MSLIPEEDLEKVRASVDIATVIGERIPLKRAGRHFKGLCPFHTEKTPSFMVNPERQIYHCFGCGEGGNTFSFLMKYEGLDFVQAVEKLAERAGIVLRRTGGDPEERKRSREEKDHLYEINRTAARFFYDQLAGPAGEKGRAYLTGRAIRPAMIREGLLGYAPADWRGLTRHLEEKKVPLPLAEKLGLVRKGDDGSWFDFFRDRLIFPILSSEAKVLGFSGRALDDAAEPKYLNSPDSPVFKKGELLLGLRQARSAIREADEAILVEGNFDQLRLAQEGLAHAVAPLGTALTQAQVRLIARWTQNFVVIFDGDAAGQKAADRALEIFLPAGIIPKVVLLPAGEDPDSFIRKFGVDALRQKVSVAPLLLDSFIDRVLREGGASPQGRGRAVRQVAGLLASLPGQIEKRLYIRMVAERADLPEGVVTREVTEGLKGQTIRSNFSVRAGEEKVEAGRSFPPASPLERTLVELLLSGRIPTEPLFEEISGDDFADPDLSLLWKELGEEFPRTGQLAVATLLDRLPEGSARQRLTELTLSAARWERAEADPGRAAADLIRRVRLGRMRGRLKGLTDEIRQAEQAREMGRLQELLARKSELLREMRTRH